MKQEFLFICENDELEIFVASKADIDSMIKSAEINDSDIDFKTIGKIKSQFLTVDFNPLSIEWYEKGEKEKAFVDKAVLKIVQKLIGY